MFEVLPEAKRLAYLEAMGIESYFPRYSLPGAKPSVLCENLPDPEALGQFTPEPVITPATDMVNVRELLPDLAKKPAAKSEVNKPKGEPQAQTVPTVQFNLRLFWVPGLALIADASPDASPEPAIHRFIANLFLAVSHLNGEWEGSIKANLKNHLFRWPLVGNSQIQHGAEAAKEAVVASLAANCERHGISRILLMGDAAVEYGSSKYDSAKVLSVESVSHYLMNPQAKRELWQSLKTLN